MDNTSAIGRRTVIAILATVALAIGIVIVAPTNPASGSNGGGPVILMGIDAEDGSPFNAHGAVSIYSGVVDDGLLPNVTNGGSGILGIGCGKSSDDVTFFWSQVASDTGQTLTCVNGASAISSQSFAGFAMIGVASSVFESPSGGLTQAEADAFNARAADVADFINNGGGLFGLSQAHLTNPYGYMGLVGTFVVDVGGFYDDVEATTDGEALGITDTNLDLCCWHDYYDEFPDFLVVLAFDPNNNNRAAAIGGAQVELTGAIDLQPSEASNQTGTDHTVTATVRDSDGNLLAGETVTFEVVSGPNVGDGATAVTDSNGEATFTYTGDGGEGTDTIRASFTDATGTLRSDTAEKTWESGDVTGPLCQLTAKSSTGIEVTVQDTGSGLGSIVVTKSVNANVTWPPFTVGTTSQVVVTATKLDTTQKAQVALRVTDVAGNITNCDPILTISIREQGQPESVAYEEIPAEEDTVTITNGSPGLKNLDVTVNGKLFKVAGLQDGAERSIDISSALHAGDDNVISLTAKGKPGASADVMIWDGGS